MQHERRLLRRGLDLRDRGAQRRGDVGVRRLVEADVAVADLHEPQAAAAGRVRHRRCAVCPSGIPFSTPPPSSTPRRCRPMPCTAGTLFDRPHRRRPFLVANSASFFSVVVRTFRSAAHGGLRACTTSVSNCSMAEKIRAPHENPAEMTGQRHARRRSEQRDPIDPPAPLDGPCAPPVASAAAAAVVAATVPSQRCHSSVADASTPGATPAASPQRPRPPPAPRPPANLRPRRCATPESSSPWPRALPSPRRGRGRSEMYEERMQASGENHVICVDRIPAGLIPTQRLRSSPRSWPRVRKWSTTKSATSRPRR